MLNLFQHPHSGCKDLSMGFRNKFGMTNPLTVVSSCRKSICVMLNSFQYLSIYNIYLYIERLQIKFKMTQYFLKIPLYSISDRFHLLCSMQRGISDPDCCNIQPPLHPNLLPDLDELQCRLCSGLRCE